MHGETVKFAKKAVCQVQASLRNQSVSKECTILSEFGMSLDLVGPIKM